MTKRPMDNPAGERAVLGALLRDPNIFFANRSRLTSRLFADQINKRIAQAISQLADAGRTFGIADLAARVATEDGTEISGYLSALMTREADMESVVDRIDDLQEAWARRTMVSLAQELLKQASEDSDASAWDRLDRAMKRARSIGDALDDIDRNQSSNIVDRVLARIEENTKRKRSDGVPWFLREVAVTTRNELEYGWFVGLLADSAGGKTSFALQQAVFSAKQGIPVLFLSGDQTEDDCYIQMAGQILSLPFETFMKGRLTAPEHRSFLRIMEELRRLPMQVVEIDAPTVRQVGRYVQSFTRNHGRGLVIIDHDDILEADDKRAQLADRVTQKDRDLKALMRKNRCAGLYLMQRNAEGEHRDVARPVDRDLVGGPRRRKSFDAILYLYREAMWLRKRAKVEKSDNKRSELMASADARESIAEIGVLKNRHSFQDGSCTVKWDGEFTRFASPEDEKAKADAVLFEDDLA